MRPLTLQSRVALGCALLVTLALLLSGLGVWIFLYRESVADLDTQLRSVAAEFFIQVERHGGVGKVDWTENLEIRGWLPTTEPRLFIEIAQPDGTVLYRSENVKDDSLQASPLGFCYRRLGDDRVRVGTFLRQDLILRVGTELDAVEDLAEDMITAFLVVLPIVLVAAVLGGRWIAQKALAPIQRIAESAEQVSAQHLDRRVPVPEARDEVRRLAVVLNRTLEQLEASFQQAMRFSADASHELKTPLTVLRSSLEALLGSPTLAGPDQPAVAGLLEQTNRISSITAGLLLLARADAGRLRVDSQPLDFAEIVASCCIDTRIVAEPAQIKIDVTLPESAPVIADETRLMQIVSNLLDNAVKYNTPGGHVRVSLAAAGKAWQLQVANTGRGIVPEHRPHIFDRFFRPEHSAAVSGHGLGLSLARELARAHGGSLDLVQSDANWTVFSLKLPS